MKLVNTPDKWGVKGDYESKKQAEVYLNDKKEWEQKLEEHKALRLDLERKLGELI